LRIVREKKVKKAIWLCALLPATLAFTAPAFAEQAKGNETLRSDSDPVYASMRVAGQRYLLERIQDYCSKENPPAGVAIQTARTNWIVEHATLLEKVPSIMRSSMSQQEQTDMNKQFRTDCDDSDRKMSMAPAAERVKWCEAQPQRIASPEMNMMQNRVLVNAIAKIDPQKLLAARTQPGYAVLQISGSRRIIILRYR
jgi:hypothetical protein